MKALAWLGLFLELLPLASLGLLVVLHPVGDPQRGSLFVRLLDYQATYWIREALPVPPPLLIVGTLISVSVNWHHRIDVAKAGMILGLGLGSIWSLIMLVPLIFRAN